MIDYLIMSVLELVSLQNLLSGDSQNMTSISQYVTYLANIHHREGEL